jgi:cardiolipin synthase
MIARPIAVATPAEEIDRRTQLRRTLEGVIGVPMTEGNSVRVLRNGNEIFPAMLHAIEVPSTRSTC